MEVGGDGDGGGSKWKSQRVTRSGPGPALYGRKHRRRRIVTVYSKPNGYDYPAAQGCPIRRRNMLMLDQAIRYGRREMNQTIRDWIDRARPIPSRPLPPTPSGQSFPRHPPPLRRPVGDAPRSCSPPSKLPGPYPLISAARCPAATGVRQP